MKRMHFYEERLDYDSELSYFLGVALEEQGQTDRAEEAYLEAIRMNPDLADAYYNLGVLMAEQAARLTEYRDPRILNILALSYAAAGYINRAVTTARKALDLAVAAEDHDLAARIQKQIKLYLERQ